jgi:hypothetical protein
MGCTFRSVGTRALAVLSQDGVSGPSGRVALMAARIRLDQRELVLRIVFRIETSNQHLVDVALRIFSFDEITRIMVSAPTLPYLPSYLRDVSEG